MEAGAIDRVAVLGLGTMGHGIAQTFAAAGCRVFCFDADPLARQTLTQRVQANLAEFVRAGVCPPNQVPAIVERLVICPTQAEAVADAQFITEAVAEDLAVKQELLARLEDETAADTVLASNSSSFPISQSGARLRRPERALVTHWFNPPHLVPAVEVVPGPRTDPAVADMAVALLRRIGKLAIRVRHELPGFLVNRVQVALQREVWDLVDRGVASIEDIDAAIRGSMGFRLACQGPLEVYDFGGLDIQASVYRNLVLSIRSDTDLPAAARTRVEQGQLGVKSGQGFYDHRAGAGEARRARRDRLFLALSRLLRDIKAE